MAFYLQLLAEATNVYPDLPKFDGKRHDELVHEFRSLDRKRLSVAQVEARRRITQQSQRLPSGQSASSGRDREEAGAHGSAKVDEAVRLADSGRQAVFMMSPLSVAQFLEPGAIEFDLLVIDEASQVEPVDALGAIARSKQIVVVGDDKQLPPTSFFSRVIGADEGSEDDEGAQVKDLESVLSLCSSKESTSGCCSGTTAVATSPLSRSPTRSSIEGKLFIVPSPDRDRSESGLRFRHFPEGRFDRGNSFKNHVEAAAIARAVVEHARTSPHLTLGVGAMSVRQRQAITDEIELARRQHPELESFIQAHPNEPFFVKKPRKTSKAMSAP
jgi:hypothetical protein